MFKCLVTILIMFGSLETQQFSRLPFLLNTYSDLLPQNEYKHLMAGKRYYQKKKYNRIKRQISILEYQMQGISRYIDVANIK